MRDNIGRQVAATGIKAEVYPDLSRPFRRTFGRDCKTITLHGILTGWRAQMAGVTRGAYEARYEARSRPCAS